MVFFSPTRLSSCLQRWWSLLAIFFWKKYSAQSVLVCEIGRNQIFVCLFQAAKHHSHSRQLHFNLNIVFGPSITVVKVCTQPIAILGNWFHCQISLTVRKFFYHSMGIYQMKSIMSHTMTYMTIL